MDPNIAAVRPPAAASAFAIAAINQRDQHRRVVTIFARLLDLQIPLADWKDSPTIINPDRLDFQIAVVELHAVVVRCRSLHTMGPLGRRRIHCQTSLLLAAVGRKRR